MVNPQTQSTQTLPARRPNGATPAPATLPTFGQSAAKLLADMKTYREFQVSLDAARPDLLITTKEKGSDGKFRTFRPKRYFMLMARLYGLRVEVISQEKGRSEQVDGNGEVWHARQIEVLVRCWDPKNPDAGETIGDGACGEEELNSRQHTGHNLRSRAMTRAQCRAISNYIAFGDPIDADDQDDAAPF